MADLLHAGTLPKITLWSSVSLKVIVIIMHSVDLLWIDVDSFKWMKTHFALVPNHNVLRTLQVSLSIKDASEWTLYQLFSDWLEFHELLDEEQLRAVKDVCVELTFGWIAMQEYDQLDSSNLLEIAQGFQKRNQYKFQVKNFGKSKKLSYCTV